jgi:vacuolar-type H+-ATPase subunit H
MENSYISIGFSVFGFIVGVLSWALNLKIQHDILVNNAKIDKAIEALKEKLSRDIAGVNENYVKELSSFKDRATTHLEDLDQNLIELKSNLADRILNTVNGKYVRSDYHQQSITGIQDRLQSFKELIEVSMTKIEQSLDRQITDLKERIFHDGK